MQNTPATTLAAMKAYFQNLTDAQIDGYHNYYRHTGIMKPLHSTAWLNLFLSGLVVLNNLTQQTTTFQTSVQTLFSIIITFVSLVTIARPTVRGIGIFAAIFAISGIWNVYIFLLNINLSLSFLVLILGILQFSWAQNYYYMWKQCQKHGVREPLPAEVQDVQSTYITLRALFGEGVKDPDAIFAKLNGEIWRGFTVADWLILIPANKPRVLLAEAHRISITPDLMSAANEEMFKGKFRFDGAILPLILKQPNLSRFALWLSRYNNQSVG